MYNDEPPLLVAINMESLSMVKLLLEHGAETHYTRYVEFPRTRLQGAVEVGSFDIIQYLSNQGAIIDIMLVYSGVIMLQSASMNEFCGLEALLLERKADPNNSPANGDGRDAFNTTVEQDHINTMSLVMQWNVDFDAQFEETLKASMNGLGSLPRKMGSWYQNGSRNVSTGRRRDIKLEVMGWCLIPCNCYVDNCGTLRITLGYILVLRLIVRANRILHVLGMDS
jgi:hypothetical protein